MIDGTRSSELPANLKLTFSTPACRFLCHTRSYPTEPTPSKVPLLLRELYLLIKNVESFLRSPFDKRRLGAYFPSDAGSSVVGVNKTGGNNEKVIWRCIWSLLVLKLTHCIVACRPNRSWIYVPKRGDWSLSWNCHRTKSKRRPNFASRCQTV